ncbi:hypothetical protein F5Y03DRAFT_120956 [Xylaria venustula]|nr:hypothetical protein F5Y03DRAFT_120956 [Xylaria venustula]
MDALHRKPPTSFFRVQHKGSFTFYHASGEGGFESRAHYCMVYSHWINEGKFNRHLDWEDTSSEPTPFISVLDNERDAKSWAAKCFANGHREIIIAQITGQNLEAIDLPIEFQGCTVHLPAWKDPSGCILLSTSDVRKHLRVSVRISRLSEWFALDFIPATMIKNVTRYP